MDSWRLGETSTGEAKCSINPPKPGAGELVFRHRLWDPLPSSLCRGDSLGAAGLSQLS